MELYKAKKGNVQFFIQPDAIENYAELGYDIIRVTETYVKDVEKEASKITAETGGVVTDSVVVEG